MEKPSEIDINNNFKDLLLTLKAAVSSYRSFGAVHDGMSRTRLSDFYKRLNKAEHFFGELIGNTVVVTPIPSDADLELDDAIAQRHEWREVGDGTPLNIWLETKREEEGGSIECFARIIEIGGEVEWIARDGVTTVTHSTFLPPTHWRWRINRFQLLLESLSEEGGIDGEFFGIPVHNGDGKIKEGFQTIYDALKIASDRFKKGK